jgi:hypothetical protein
MARYDTQRKVERNSALYEYKQQHPEASWREVGRAFGVTRQRAQQIYRREELRRQ